jgi:AraC family transcriptional regulator
MTLRPSIDRAVVPGIEVVREGRVEAFLQARPALSSTAIRWTGLAVEDYHIPACVIPQHQHVHDFLHVVLSGTVRYEVLTAGKRLHYTAQPGTTFVLPRGTVDELRWSGPTHRIAVAVHPSLLLSATDETIGRSHIELTEHWNATDRHIVSLLLALTTDLDEGSPAGRLYGDSLANALAVYLLSRYAVHRRLPIVPRGGLPRHRLKRVLDYIGDNLAENVSLSDLADLAGMSAHHFAELFKRSMNCTPHRFVLQERIERAKIALRDPTCSILDAATISGFQNPSHFARAFRRLIGISPSQFRSDQTSLSKIAARPRGHRVHDDEDGQLPKSECFDHSR